MNLWKWLQYANKQIGKAKCIFGRRNMDSFAFATPRQEGFNQCTIASAEVNTIKYVEWCSKRNLKLSEFVTHEENQWKMVSVEIIHR